MSAPPSLTPGFVLMQSNDLDALRSVLVDWLARAPLPALTDETIIIQSNGMSQWLRLGLCQPRSAGGLGVGVGVSFEFPARVQWQCYRSVLGADRVPNQSPLDKSTLVWRLMRVLPSLLDDPRFTVFHAQLLPQGQLDAQRLYDLCVRLADQWDAYQVYRADWLTHWAGGGDDLPRGEKPLPSEAQWQPVLWRHVLKDVAQTSDVTLCSRSTLHQHFLAQAGQGMRPADFPPRLIVFGVSSLAPQILDLLVAAARWSQVIVCVQNPCQVYWADMLPTTPNDPSPRVRQNSHPLLAAWGRQGRDLLRLLTDFEAQSITKITAPSLIASFIETAEPRQILQQIQNDILTGCSATELRAQQRNGTPDASVAFHSVHSPLRAVEVLHDQLLAAFGEDASLKPEHILVMMPDIAAYAPAVQAIFGRFGREDPRFIPFAIADQPDPTDQARQAVLLHLFELPHSRFERSELLDWLSLQAIQTALGFSEEEVTLLRDWLNQSDVYWGLDATQRTEFGAPAEYTLHSWQFGLDRLFTGYLLGNAETVWQGIAPLDGLDISQAAVIGRLQQFLEILAEARQFLMMERSPIEWQAGLHALFTRLFQASAEDTATALWQKRVAAAVDDWCKDCLLAGWQDALPASVVQAAIFERLSRHRLSQKFLVSGINFATLMPMRAIPYRQVYLLGMDEKEYPRRQPRQDFDLLEDRYRPGDRARQEDDRYLFLEAILAAKERLVISWIGRAVQDNSPRSPSIVVQQLRDYLDMAWQTPDGSSFSRVLTVEHPLQPFSPAYFRADSTALFTFAAEWRRVHEYAANPTSDVIALPIWTPSEPCTVADLGKFLKDPLDPLMRIRWGIGRTRAPQEQLDHEPFVLDGLRQWQIYHELARRLRVDSPADSALDDWFSQAKQRMAASGRMPWRFTQWDALITQPLRAQWQRWQTTQQNTVATTVVPANTLSSRTTNAVLQCADIQVQVTESGHRISCRWIDSKLLKSTQPAYEKCLEFWPQHLAAQLSGVPVATHLVGKDDTVVLQGLDSNEAEHHLIVLLDIWYQALQEPLPIAPKLAFAQCELLGGLDDKNARAKLEEAFIGTAHGHDSDLQTLPWMARFWPDIDVLLTAQTQWATHKDAALEQLLYEPVRNALMRDEALGH